MEHAIVDIVSPLSAGSVAHAGRRRRRWLAPALILLVVAGGLSWWATRGLRASASAERAIGQMRARLEARLEQLGAVPLSVSPDRRLAVIGRRLDTGQQLQLVRVADGNVLGRALLEAPGEFTWRTAGDRLAFTALDAGQGGVYLWDGAGAPRAVETWSGGEAATHLAWDARGEELAFVRPESGPSPGRLVRLVTADGGGLRTLVTTTDVRGLAWLASAPHPARPGESGPAARLAVVAPPLCRDGVAVLGAPTAALDRAGGGAVRCLAIGKDAEVKHVASDARAEHLLVTGRPHGAQFFSLFELDVGTGAVRALAAPDGDVELPSYITGGGYLYHVERGGQSTLQLVQRGRTSSPLGEGRSRLLGFSADGATAFVSHLGLTRAPQLLELSLEDGRTSPLLLPGAASQAGTAVRPEPLVIEGGANLQLHDFLWRSPHAPGRRKLVVEVAAHGAPPDPTFRVPRALLIDEGFDVLLASYRGVTGFGADFADDGNPWSAAEDLGRTVQYAVERLGYRPADIAILAAGHAATLVTLAATLAPDHLRQMLLINPAPTTCTAKASTVTGRRVTLVYGEGSARSLAETEFFATSWLGAGSVSPPSGRVRRLDGATLRSASPAAMAAITEEIARLLLPAPG
jgi:dipeptidyl aminopeptidase/acylaminoacyl peptidase